MDKYIGKILGNRYEILERIGSGGMAVVYKAKCHLLNRFVAVKILKEDLAGDEEFRRRFHEESQAVAMLSHPNIVSIYDVSQSEDPSQPDYIVMELIEGITLKQYMQKQGGRLSWKEALHFITQIMMGLSHAHSRGIIHRDIKPHNIMILRDGSVRVADFGIARLMSAAQNTMTQEALGSVHYISPEQARGSHVDCRSDIYSAGVVLYEMLTGRLPYEGDSPVAVAIQHINSIPLSPRELDPTIPQALEAITMKAMVSDVEKRYPSADAMLSDLEEFRKNPNISFDYTLDDLQGNEADEPTQPLQKVGAQAVPVRPVHGTHPQNERAGRPAPRKPRYEPEEDDDDYEEGGGFARTLVIISALILCLVCIGAFLWETVFKGMTNVGQTYQVPDFVNCTLDEARSDPAILEGIFELKEGRNEFNNDIEAGHIIRQDPLPNTEAKKSGQVITVIVSKGSEAKPMPNLLGAKELDARRALEKLDLRLEINTREEFDDVVDSGRVISYTPETGTALEWGQQIELVVSKGRKPQESTLISFINMTEEEATSAAQGMKLRLNIKRVYNDRYAEGKVCSQTPEARTIVKEQDLIQLEISLGPEILPPPDATTLPSKESPAVVTQAPALIRKDIKVEMPTDRDFVTIQIAVDGTVVKEETRETRVRFARFTVEGYESQQITVYIDGEPVRTEGFVR